MCQSLFKISILAIILLVGACTSRPYPPVSVADIGAPGATPQAGGSTAIAAPPPPSGFEVPAPTPSLQTAALSATAETGPTDDADATAAGVAEPGGAVPEDPDKPSGAEGDSRSQQLQISQSESTDIGTARQAQAQIGLVRPGDVIEVRFYRNTRLEGDRYAVEVGDVLQVDVVDHPDLTRPDVLVLPDGYVSLPLAGSLKAAGRNVDQLSKQLAGRYEKEGILDPKVNVSVVQSDRRLETLFGSDLGGGAAGLQIAVSEAGILGLPFVPPIRTGRTMAELLQTIRAAYWREFGGRLEVTANLVQRGVPLIYVMGEVTTPAGVPYVRRLNPIQAVAAAGGMLPTAEPEDVRVIRFSGDGSYDFYTFDFEAELDGEGNQAANFELLPQDVVFVRPSGITQANRWVEQYIRNLVPFSLNAGFGVSYEIDGDSD